LITLSADSTNLPGWKISQYYWNFGDETIALGKNVNKTYIKPGTYNIQLIISSEPDPAGNAREACVSKNINIIRQP
jgi:PKD repeat protein